MSLPPVVEEARLGPKAAEDDLPPPPRGKASRRGISPKAILPNAITAAAMCSGLTGIRFAMEANWPMAVGLVILAGMLDGIDGRVARLLNAQSRFGAELDSLADSLSFGTAPALIVFLWSLHEARIGWLAALALAIACALRLARFNAQIDVDVQPHKSAGFLTGIPAPAGAGLVFLPFYLWQETGVWWLRAPVVVGPWVALIALLMISNLATLSWGSLRPPRSIRIGLIFFVAVLFAALILEPWKTLAVICVGYLITLPIGYLRYARVMQQRASQSRIANS